MVGAGTWNGADSNAVQLHHEVTSSRRLPGSSVGVQYGTLQLSKIHQNFQDFCLRRLELERFLAGRLRAFGAGIGGRKSHVTKRDTAITNSAACRIEGTSAVKPTTHAMSVPHPAYSRDSWINRARARLIVTGTVPCIRADRNRCTRRSLRTHRHNRSMTDRRTLGT